VEGKDDAGGVFAWREVSGVSKPVRWEKNFTTVADGVTRELACEVLRGGNRTIGKVTDGYAAENDVPEAGNGDTTGTRAEGEAEDIVEDRDVFRRGGAFEGVDEIFAERVRGGPAPREELKGTMDGV